VDLPDRAAVADATRGNDPDSGEAFEITGQARDAASEGTGEGVSVAAAVEADAADVVEAAGHFRIYLGAAAGVGKTYAMLNEAAGGGDGVRTS